MYSHVVYFSPNHIYLSIDFKQIKEMLLSAFDLFEDYDSIITLKKDDSMVSVNNIGSTIVFTNKEDVINKLAKEVEDVFKQQITEFELKIKGE